MTTAPGGQRSCYATASDVSVTSLSEQCQLMHIMSVHITGGTGGPVPRIWSGAQMQIVPPDFQKIPLRIHQNTPFRAKKILFLPSTKHSGSAFASPRIPAGLTATMHVKYSICSIRQRKSQPVVQWQIWNWRNARQSSSPPLPLPSF